MTRFCVPSTDNRCARLIEIHVTRYQTLGTVDSVDTELHAWVQVTGDLTPIYYLVERYLGDQAAAREQAMQQVADMLQHLPELMAVAGLAKKKR